MFLITVWFFSKKYDQLNKKIDCQFQNQMLSTDYVWQQKSVRNLLQGHQFFVGEGSACFKEAYPDVYES